jgi:hypothetical protein
MCSCSNGEAYFDLEEGLWLKPSPPGTTDYFDEDTGEWMRREFGPWFTMPHGPLPGPLPTLLHIDSLFMLKSKGMIDLR